MSDQNITIQLNNYQASALKAVIEAIGYPYSNSAFRSPLNVLDSGDWLSEIWMKLDDASVPSPTIEDTQFIADCAINWMQ